MPFKKGESGNNKGRPKGAKNRNTAEARKLFQYTIAGEIPKIEEAFQKVREQSPEKYLDLLCKYIHFFMPKKTEQDIKTEIGGEFNFNDALKQLRDN